MSNRPEFKPGFRLSPLDVVVLIGGAVLSVVLWRETWWTGFIVAFVVGHFFLFCNLVRMARSLELAWSAVFVALAAATIAFNVPTWPVTIALSLTMTIAVVIVH